MFLDLVSRGLVERVGDGRGTSYRLASGRPGAVALPARRTRPRREDLLRVLEPGQPMKVADIVDSTTFTERQVRHALGALVKQGRVTASRVSGLRGLRYVVVEDGEGRQQLTEEHA
jgi:predicted ArsR family transcriptional regulator